MPLPNATEDKERRKATPTPLLDGASHARRGVWVCYVREQGGQKRGACAGELVSSNASGGYRSRWSGRLVAGPCSATLAVVVSRVRGGLLRCCWAAGQSELGRTFVLRLVCLSAWFGLRAFVMAVSALVVPCACRSLLRLCGAAGCSDPRRT